MKNHKEHDRSAQKGQHVTFDVVCGMDIAVEEAKCSSVYHDVTYYFCSQHCKQHFENAPERYVWDK